MSNSNSTFHSITPKLQEFFIQNPDIIALTTSNFSVLHFNSLPPNEKDTSNNTSQSESVNEEEGWNDENTRLLINFLEEKFSNYKKNKSNFAKMASNKVFPEKLWEQIKNKLGRL
ncbi:19430_t:CDS:2, partial [Funneliformis geosporum]